MNLVTLDFETTGKDAKIARPIEFGYASPDDGAYEGVGFIALPLGENIPPETSAVHHIIDEDIEGAPSWDDTLNILHGQFRVDGSLESLVLIAHNAEYEQDILANTMFDARATQWVCTFKCALVAWPDAPSHSNEALRYWLQLGARGRVMQQAPHSALHDARVTAGIFNCLRGYFNVELCPTLSPSSPESDAVVIPYMIALSKLPAQLPTCPIGDWRGKPWAEVDAGFLRWMINKPIDREDAIYCARQELERRAAR